MRYCRLSGLRDLRHGKDYVRQMLAAYLNALVDLGVAGFRVDAAKHVLPADLQHLTDMLHDLPTAWFPPQTKPFIFQEVCC